jgi:hypothetical protein
MGAFQFSLSQYICHPIRAKLWPPQIAEIHVCEMLWSTTIIPLSGDDYYLPVAWG